MREEGGRLIEGEKGGKKGYYVVEEVPNFSIPYPINASSSLDYRFDDALI